MLPDFKAELTAALAAACRALAPDAQIPPATTLVERPKNRQMGDFASPAAMQLAPALKQNPRQVAADILQNWTPPAFVESADIAGPGFINIRIRPQDKTAIIRDILQNPKQLGRGAPQNQFIHLEFVSANPTGPLHVGHGRGAAYGDSLARILAHAGFPVATEYYLNDAGLQINILSASVWLRHQHPENWDDMPRGSYRGTYLRQTADHLRPWLQKNAPPLPADLLEKIAAQEDEDAAAQLLANTALESFGADKFAELKIQVRNFMTEKFLKADLDAMGVHFDRWFSENDNLRAVGKVEAVLQKLRQIAPDSLYEKDGALWFRAEKFGDEKDRVVRRTNGEFTYFAADIAYCEDKFARETPGGAPVRAVYVLGADHHGYAPRLRAAASALGRDPEKLETPLIQFVALKRADELIPMSTRAGRFVSLRELLDAVGTDAARFFFVSRKTTSAWTLTCKPRWRKTPTTRFITCNTPAPARRGSCGKCGSPAPATGGRRRWRKPQPTRFWPPWFWRRNGRCAKCWALSGRLWRTRRKRARRICWRIGCAIWPGFFTPITPRFPRCPRRNPRAPPAPRCWPPPEKSPLWGWSCWAFPPPKQ